jgi:cytochrome c-type biogenesis protein CcmI
MMIAFWIIGGLLGAAAISFVVWPLLASRGRVGLSRSATNLSIYRDQARELDADRNSGTLDPEQYEKAKRELEARLLEDLQDTDAPPRPPRRGRPAAIAAALTIPLVAVTVYFAVGNPYALVGRQAVAAAHDSGQPLEVLVERLAARMAQNPADAQGWVMLGRSYQALGRYSEGVEAFTKALAQLPGNADVMADYAHATALAEGGRLRGEPQKILARALEADPDNLKALALAGSAAFESEDYAAAADHWQRMLSLVQPGSETARALQERIAEAQLQPPGALGDLKLLHASRGKEALEEINRLHGKELGAKAGYVAHYEKEGAAAMIYLAEASSADEAARQVDQMRTRIQRGDTPFSGLKTLTAGKTTLYSVLGQGQTHYFYRKEASVLWLAADAPVAKQSLAALVSLSTNPSGAVKRSQE